MAKIKGVKPLVQNRRARHDYFVEESFECGMELKGTEVKSIRQGRANLKESYARVRNGEVYVDGMHISPYEQGGLFNPDPLRPKRLLLHKIEIRRLQGLVSRDGYTLIPLQLYLKDGRVKLELGVCRGKQLHDKRDDIAERDAMRDIERAMRQDNRGRVDDSY
jgi:SsrA-binding protein